MTSTLRLTSLFAVLLASVAFAGRGKILEVKTVPKSVKTVSEALPKEKKDVNRRSAMSLVLDDLLRAQPEVTEPALYDQLAGSLFSDVLDRMAEPGDAFSTDVGPDKYTPRADVFFRETVKVKPGRLTKDFFRKYTKKMQGKNIDRAYRNQPLTLSFNTAASDDEYAAWTESKGWGVVVHTAHVDTAAGVARIGCTFVSPGGRFERPSWVAFYKQAKPGVGAFQLLAIEPVIATDWREQPINVVPPKVEPNELSRKLALHVWMEQVRGIPSRPAFLPQEEQLFNVQLEGADKIEAAQLPWLEQYRDSDSPMVRAAATLKAVSLGAEAKPDSVYIISRGLRHPVARARMEELLKKAPQGWTPPPLPPGFKDEAAAAMAAADAGTKLDGGVKKGADGGK